MKVWWRRTKLGNRREADGFCSGYRRVSRRSRYDVVHESWWEDALFV
jgi:hypothetical protein